MIRAWLIAAAISGFLSVVAGAVAAHLDAGDHAAGLLRTGTLYGMIHAAALVGVAAVAGVHGGPTRGLITAGWCFAGGTILFSLSLFGLALTGIEWLGMVTPFGGIGLLLGWAALALHAFDRGP
jgi:uncharacterized membrane protein YgdD (TMEM256/DUF423 family)